MKFIILITLCTIFCSCYEADLDKSESTNLSSSDYIQGEAEYLDQQNSTDFLIIGTKKYDSIKNAQGLLPFTVSEEPIVYNENITKDTIFIEESSDSIKIIDYFYINGSCLDFSPHSFISKDTFHIKIPENVLAFLVVEGNDTTFSIENCTYSTYANVTIKFHRDRLFSTKTIEYKGHVLNLAY